MMVAKGLVYQFDNVQVEPDEFRVLKAGEPVSLEPKAFEVLLYFIENPGRLIEKEELLNAVWKDAFVTQNAMTRVIAQLRKALGDDAKEARYIETVPTRGYRFIGDIQLTTNTASSAKRISSNIAELDRPSELLIQNNESKSKSTTQKKRVLIASAVVVLLATILAGRWIFIQISFSAPHIKRTTQITTWTGLDIYPAISPDGNSIAYSSNHDGNFEIYVRQIARGGKEIKLTSDGGQNYEPAWSPDGKLIAYYNKSRGGIWVIPALGGIARQLTDFGSRPAWSPSGTSIAFQSDGLNDVGATAYGAMSPSTLWIVSSDGGQPKQLTQPDKPLGGHSSPAWSPDGKRILFASYGISHMGIYSVSLDGSGLVAVYRGQAFDPIYSVDGEGIYFSGATSNAAFSIFKLRVDSTSGEPIGKPIEVKSTGAMVPKHLRISSDGKMLVYTMLWLSNNLWSVPISAGAVQPTGPPVPITNDTSYRKTLPVFSLDGSKLYYIDYRTGDEPIVHIADGDGQNQRDLISQTKLGLLSGWFPDNRIATVTWNKDGAQLGTISIDSGRVQPLMQITENIDWPRLSPDGKYLAYHSDNNGAVNTWVLPMDGGKTKQLTFGNGFIGFPSWSPDSKFLTVEIRQGENTQIGIVPVDGGQITQLTSDQGQSWPFSWSPDNDKIVFAGLRNGIWNIWTISTSTKEEKQITSYSTSNAFVRYPAWSPKGDRIVYEYAETTGNIWLTEFR